MSQSRLKRFRRRLRIAFRAFRFVIWILLIAVLLSVLYVNRIGLPDFAKKRVIEHLRSRGVELEFQRLRLRFDQGLVAEEVRFSGLESLRGPAATARVVHLAMDWRALRAGKLRVAGLRIRDGLVRWALIDPRREPRQLALDHLQMELLFRTNDVWELANLGGQFAGARVHFDGALTNASAWREWPAGRVPAPVAESSDRLRARLFALAENLDRIHFASQPDLNISFRGDLRDWTRWDTLLELKASGIETPWGAVTNGLATARLWPVGAGGLRVAQVSLQADTIRTSWADADSANVQVKLSDVGPPSEEGTNGVAPARHWPEIAGLRDALISFEAGAVRTHWAEAASVTAQLKLAGTELAESRLGAELNLRTSRVNTRWAQSGSLKLNARWQQALTNQVPSSANFDLQLSNLESRWGKLTDASVKARMQTPIRAQPLVADASWGLWRWLEPYWLSAEIEAGRLTTPKLIVDRAQLSVDWKAPQFELTRFDARLYRGGARGTGTLDVTSRRVLGRAEMDFDLQEFAPMMTTNGVKWLRQFAWNEPPHAHGAVEGVLPAWTNRESDWRAEVLPTLKLDGEFKIGRGAFRSIPVESAASHVTYSNMTWRLPDLLATRPEGQVRLEHIANDRTRDYYFKFDSAIDPNALRPVLATNQHRIFEMFQFGELPLVKGEVWGRWRRPELVGLAGTVAVSNLTFRSETGLVVRAALQYTNRIVNAWNVEGGHGGRTGRVEGLEVNFPTDCLFLTNATGNLDPMVIARAIGPKTAKAFEPYRFLTPPDFKADGTIPLHYTNDQADLRVELSGGPFEWWKITLPQLTGTVHWQRDLLSLSNVSAGCYGGTATGDAQFDIRSEEGTRMRFQLQVTNGNLHAFLADLKPGRSNVHGTVTGRLIVTDAISTNWQTWNGHGEVKLREGLLWNVPLFGAVFSTVLNVAVPGARLGNSRATEAVATFGITNGVVHTEDMRVETLLMVLFLRGDMTLEGELDGRVEASLLREVWLLGRPLSILFSPLTKALEYRITGSLQAPKVEPFYGPTRLLLHPFRTIKDAFTPGPENKEKRNIEKPPISGDKP